VFFAPDGILPLFGFNKSIATIHDLSFLIYPETLKKGAYTFFNKNFLITIKKADIIVTVSKHSKADILKFYHPPEKKIKVIYNGVNNFFFNELTSDEKLNIQKKFSLNNPFIFYLGTIEPRKNLVSVIKAFNRISYNFTNLLLVIGGLGGWLTEEIESEVNFTNSKKKKIILTGNLTDSEYKFLLKKAEIFLYVPLYEGFGLPVLEAMASGCRVITSNTSSLPEITGDSCIKVTPGDIDSITQNIEILLNEDKKINKKAIQRAKSFSWSKSAEKHMQIIKDLIDRDIY
jgi:glycosyltransferase involved in cell wall biosynthesis